MGEDRALDEFLGDDDDDGGDADESGAATGAEREAGPADGDGAGADDANGEPSADDRARTASTTAFVPGGAPCESCGASVRRRWRDDDALVCADCKVW
jgi:hypothetical protein